MDAYDTFSIDPRVCLFTGENLNDDHACMCTEPDEMVLRGTTGGAGLMGVMQLRESRLQYAEQLLASFKKGKHANNRRLQGSQLLPKKRESA